MDIAVREHRGQTRMPIFLVQENVKEPPAIVGALRAMLPNLKDARSLAALKLGAKSDGDEKTIVLIALPRGNDAYFEQLVEAAKRAPRNVFFVLLGEEIAASAYKRLLRTGAADWASVSANPTEVLDIIARHQESSGEGGDLARGRYPVTISFIPSAGGVGNATLLVETATYIKTNKSTRHRKVCLIDLDFQTSHICDYLDSEPRLQIAELSSAPERLDEHLFESFRTRHNSGIDVFAAPRSKFAFSELNIHALDALLSMIARRYELVFIDYPVTSFSWTRQVISASDGAIVTGLNTIPCLRQISETLAFVRSCGPSPLPISVVINRCERNMLGSISRRKQVEMVLREERLFFLANNPDAVESVNMGVPMMLSASARKLRKEIAPLADHCAKWESRRVAA